MTAIPIRKRLMSTLCIYLCVCVCVYACVCVHICVCLVKDIHIDSEREEIEQMRE